MKLALFAANQVGLEVARFFGENREPLGCLVLDARADSEINSQIIESSGLQDASRIFYSDALSKPETLAALSALELDLIILAWWPYIIKEPVLRLPRLGALNFHPSLLPYNRGKHYNFWALVEEAPFGVTLHWVDEGIDSGDIAFQSQIETGWEDTGATLYHKAQQAIVKLFIEKFPEIKNGQIPRIPQDTNQGSFHLSKELEQASRIELDRTYTARQLLNLLRARTFAPHPGAWFMDQDEKYEVRVEITKVGEEKRT